MMFPQPQNPQAIPLRWGYDSDESDEQIGKFCFNNNTLSNII